MATNNTLNKALNQQPLKVSAKNASIKVLLESPTIQAKFQNVLKDKSSGFVSSVLNVVNTNGYLADAQPMSIMTSAMVAATLDLPIDPNLGYAYIVPFNGKNKETNRWEKKAQLIIGYKGYIQLAQRSGQYRKLNVAPIPEGAFISWNPLAEELKYDFSKATSDTAVGYAGYFELLNGFTKTVYWTRDQVEAHRIANNKAKDKRALTGVWRDNYDAMATKTVLRSMLGRWGILSIEMQNAVSKDEQPQELTDDGQLVDDRLDITDDATSYDSPHDEADEDKSGTKSDKHDSELTKQQQQDIFDAVNSSKK
ncbi:recombinase RecT [Lactiplantibacillus paraxiangfangensis]|uniref:recombinase RecT n=1 Tax=Lactiplantibacillus paraxiangfangensis TaxID=3076224 RepID=UPI0030C73565